MVHFYPIDVIRHLLIFEISICWCQSILNYHVNEETDPGFVIGNINSHVITNFEESDQYQVSLIHSYFSILSNKDLIVKKKIDLERICNDANICCGISQCIVQFPVLIVNNINGRRNRFNIEVEVVDINDNPPTFRSQLQTLSILENSKIGTQISVEGGFDSDVSAINQIQFYKFEELSRTFKLDSTDLASLSLVLDKSIDYERKKEYRARLDACDNITRCVQQSIIIRIIDENDNIPTFVKRRFEVQIPESFQVGKVVIAARAIDLDGAQYNKTKYNFYNNRDSNLAMKFRINPTNGDIILKSKLSASQRLTYVFKIYAMDAFHFGSKDIAEVVINILDINDNKPNIEVFNTDRIIDDKETFEMRIQENEPAKKLMSIRVSDADLGFNAKVTCELKDHTSSLESKFFEPDVYEISSVRNFDYEQEKQIKAIFECKDGGTPSLTSYKSIKINIDDVNEYTPEFDQSEFHSSIKENTGPGEAVLTVRAVDKDGAAVLTYSIEETVTQYFAINPSTGVIKTASMSFDREVIKSKTFRVTVTDALVNPRSAETTVRINILDENDNDPVFVPSSLQFFISENQPLKSRLHGKPLATDIDKDASNSYISFSLIDTFDSELKRCERPYFRMKFNGEVETLSQLDREITSNFTLTIEARDKGNPPRFTRANATVIVHDINDNQPQWVYPRPPEDRRQSVNTLPMLNLSESTNRYLLIMKLKAYDPDQNEAGRVTYELVNHHEGLFSLNDTNGELRTEKSPLPYGQYQLLLRASDHGTPSLHSDSLIMINVIDSGKMANINLTIIIGLVGITALISIFLIVAIICVRRRPTFQQSYMAPSTDENKDQGNQYFSHNQWMYHPTDDSAMPPLSDNDSCIYLPAGFYEQQDPLILHSMTTGSRSGSRLDYPLVLPSSNHGNNPEHKCTSQSSQNLERPVGTLRLNNGQYCTLNPSTSGIMVGGQELDGDSADSGKGASEVDLRLQHQLNNGNRNYSTMPFQQHTATTSTFGYQGSGPGPQYYSINSNPKSFDSRFLTVNSSGVAGNRRVMSPAFNSSNPCQCFMLPEDDVIHVTHDNNHIPMTTFSQQSMCNLKSLNHEHSYIYGDDIHSASGIDYYPHCPYVQEPRSRLSQSPIPANEPECVDDTRDNDNQTERPSKRFDVKKKNPYPSSEQVNQENNIYTLGLAN